MRPRDVLAARNVLAEMSKQRIRNEGAAGRDPDGSDAASVAHACVDHLRDGATYMVSAEMTAVARRAGESFPLGLLRTDNLPADSGFMLFESPIGSLDDGSETYPIRAVIWGRSRVPDLERPKTSTGERSVPSDVYEAGGESAEYDMAEVVEIIPCASLPDRPGLLIPVNGWELWPGEDEPNGPVYVGAASVNWRLDGVATGLAAAWVLMQQSISETARYEPNNSARRALAKQNIPNDLVIVTLRRVRPPTEEPELEPGTSAAKQWTHRWLVGGHWRKQYYPSDDTRRPIWINPYVKGPEHKPVVIKDRLTAWVR